ncbi:MAG: ABC-2 family transporter protein [Anaerolineae bacterium]|nr:ABC-2 family transporter protein [Thermoflexales bacterium]MDW8406327.1 ABC-2 family transporter protein [Anaerolineae bacterium]
MVRKYLALMRLSWGLSLEYRAEGFIWMMTNLLNVIMLLVWLSISKAGPVNGFAQADFIAYYMIGLLVRQLTAAWTSWELSFAISEGRLSTHLLRPIHPIHQEIAINWSEKAMRLTILLPVVATVLLMTPGVRLNVTPPAFVAFVASVAGAWALYFLADYCVGILAFWTTQATAFTNILWGLKIALGGILAPIQMFPPALQAALDWLPFKYMLAFSSEIALGQLGDERVLFGLAVQWGWVAALWLLMRWLWKLGVRSYSAVGA